MESSGPRRCTTGKELLFPLNVSGQTYSRFGGALGKIQYTTNIYAFPRTGNCTTFISRYRLLGKAKLYGEVKVQREAS
jgi:hypothetical protein